MFDGFSPELFQFFAQLKRNNNREWFAEHKHRYEETVLFPAMEFVTAMESPLQKVAPLFLAVRKRIGGSIMRIYRDTRFSKNKTPYKTNLGIHFRHEIGKDVHAPGFYIHLAADECFFAAGIWQPESSALNQIRWLLDDDPKRWKRLIGNSKFRQNFEFSGACLKRPPKGYEPTHPMIEELKRKDHIIVSPLTRDAVCSPEFVSLVTEKTKHAMPYVRFLCDAMHLPS